MQVKDLKRLIEHLDDELEVRVMNVLHYPMQDYIMCHTAETVTESVVNDDRYFCIVGHGKSPMPVHRGKIPTPKVENHF